MSEQLDWQVEASRRTLRALLSRRDFLTAAGFATVGAMGVAACGSSETSTISPPPPPPGGIPDGFHSITGSVSLPAGSALKLTDLSVDVLAQTVPVSTTSAFTAGIPSSGPSLGLLVDKNGNGVLMAMFDPASSTHEISSRTTAVALLYYGVSAYSLPAAATSRVLTLLDADPALAAVEAAVARAVAADPSALANNAAPIGPAIVQALQTIMGAGGGPKALPPARLEDPVPTLMLLSPSDPQSGVTVSQAPDTTALLVSNAKRRPCRVYVYETATVSPGNAPVPTDPPVRVAGPFDVNPTEALNLINALSDFTTFNNGKSPFQPVNLPAIPLALHTGTDRTEYTVVVLMASWKDLQSETFEPPIFRKPLWANEVSAWRVDNNNLFTVCFFGSLVLPLLCLFLGAGALDASYAVVAQVVLSAAAVGSATYKRIINQLEYGSLGKLKDGLAAVVRDALTSDTSIQFYKDEVRQVVNTAEAKALAAESAAAAGTRMSRAAKMFSQVFEPLFALGAALELVDYGAVIVDLWNSDLEDNWTALLVRQLLNLNPQNPTVSPGERVTFGISKPANTPNGTFEYDWTQSSPLDTLSPQGEANAGLNVTTSKLVVDLLTSGSDAVPVSVLVIGYDTSSGQRIEIGRAGTTVKFLQRAEIVPANAAVEVNEQRLFSVNVDGTLPSGVHYRWTLTGNGGTIGSTNVVTTTVPQINYTGLATGGVDVLQVEVLDAGGTVVARASTSVTTLAPFVEFTVAGIWASNTAPPPGTYRYTDIHGSRAPNTSLGVDVIFMDYDNYAIGNGLDDPGIAFELIIPIGSTLRAGQTFTKFSVATMGVIAAGQFQLTWSPDLDHPEKGWSALLVNIGSLTVTAVNSLASGDTAISFTYSVSNGVGGTISGSGVGGYR